MVESFSLSSLNKKQKKFANLYEAAEKVSKNLQFQTQKECCFEEITKITYDQISSEEKIEKIKVLLMKVEQDRGK